MTTPAPATLCLVNPHAAGGRGAADAAVLADALRQHDATLPPPCVEPELTAALARVAALPRGSRVLLAGGDGTVHRLLPALADGGHTLALLPCGTGNDLARALGLPRHDLRAALRVALTQPATPMDLGRVRTADGAQHRFASSVTVGFDGAVAHQAAAVSARWRGLPRYLLATLATLRSLKVQTMTLEIDGQTLPAAPRLFASSLNTPTYASGMPVAPGARLDDGWLDLVLAGGFSRPGALLALPLLLTGLHRHHPRIALRRFRQLTVSASEPLPLALDGEPLPWSPQVQVHIDPAALQVVRAPSR